MGIFEDNEKKVQTVLERGIGVLAQNYLVRKLDAGKFANPVTRGIQFRIAHYEIQGVGHLMTMVTENAPAMQMATYTLTPYFKKLPLLSADFIYKDQDEGQFLIEVYELVANREDADFQSWVGRYAKCFEDISDVADIPTQPCFYDPIRPVYASKKRTFQRDQACIQNLVDTVKLFVEQEAASDFLSEEDRATQAAIQHKYVDDLIDQNGISTQLWVKDHGADYVREYFHDIFFGV